jgi:transcriptional regulator with XRE-family HTH domain
MRDHLTQAGVIELLRKRMASESLTGVQLAAHLKCAPAYISQVLAGGRVRPGPKVLRWLGLERSDCYVPAKGRKTR